MAYGVRSIGNCHVMMHNIKYVIQGSNPFGSNQPKKSMLKDIISFLLKELGL